MTAFLVLAAGAGTRMGRTGGLHKALVPLGGKAVISHQFALAPPGARLVVCTGNRAQQVRDYIELAHPSLVVTFVPVPDWDLPGSGPGASLLAARNVIGDDDLIFTSCDTLWRPDESLWQGDASWSAVAPVPAATPLDRWCRIVSDGAAALAVLDKVPDQQSADAYTGLSRVRACDLDLFWLGIEDSALLGGERQVTAGLDTLTRARLLGVRRVAWTDTGDEAAYARAVAVWSGYDWSKPDEVTYVLPDQGRVVKFQTAYDAVLRLARRQEMLSPAVPVLTGVRPGMLAYEYVPGVTGYVAAETDPGLVTRLLDWADVNLWDPVLSSCAAEEACDWFYRVKTHARIEELPAVLRPAARHAAGRVRWDELARGCDPVIFHGDFNLGNVIVTPDGGFYGIDWRGDFAGHLWGDRRYDLAKLMAGLIVNWENARRGDFRPWPVGAAHLRKLADWFGGEIPHDVQVIAAVSLLNCAPLHAAPLDEVLVARAAALLEELV